MTRAANADLQWAAHVAQSDASWQPTNASQIQNVNSPALLITEPSSCRQ